MCYLAYMPQGNELNSQYFGYQMFDLPAKADAMD